MSEIFSLRGSFHPHTHWNGMWSTRISGSAASSTGVIPEPNTAILEDPASSPSALSPLVDVTPSPEVVSALCIENQSNETSSNNPSVSQSALITTTTNTTSTTSITPAPKSSSSIIKKSLKRSSSHSTSTDALDRGFPFKYLRSFDDASTHPASFLGIPVVDEDISVLNPAAIDNTFTIFLPSKEEAVPPVPLVVAKLSEWRGTFTVGYHSATSSKTSRTVSDRFMLTLSPPEPETPFILSARGEGSAAVGMYKLTGTWNLETMVLDMEKVYTGVPKAKSPQRPRTIRAKQPPLLASVSLGAIGPNGALASGSSSAGEVAETGETSAQIAARRVSGRQRIRNKLLNDSLWEDENVAGDDVENDGSNEGALKKRQKTSEDGTVELAVGTSGIKTVGGGCVAQPSSSNILKKKSKSGPLGAWGTKRSLPVGFPGPAHRFYMMHGRDHMAQSGTQVFLAAHVIPASLEPPSLVEAASNPYSTATIGAAISTDRTPGSQQLSLASGCIYEGEMLSGRPHGFGTLVYSNGLMFEGSFLHGREHGWGVLSDPDDRTLYEGELIDGVFHGAGIYSFGNGDRYCGGWKHGLPHGRGVFTSNTGASYDGDFVDGQRHGAGIMTFCDGSVYNGYWRSNMKHGKGEISINTLGKNGDNDDDNQEASIEGVIEEDQMINENGVYIYKGNWVNDVMDGKGEIVYTDGSTFEGTIKDGKRDGRGTYTFSPGGEQFSGKFIADAIFAATSSDPLTGTVFMKNTALIASGEIMIPISASDLKGLGVRVGFGIKDDD